MIPRTYTYFTRYETADGITYALEIDYKLGEADRSVGQDAREVYDVSLACAYNADDEVELAADELAPLEKLIGLERLEDMVQASVCAGDF